MERKVETGLNALRKNLLTICTAAAFTAPLALGGCTIAGSPEMASARARTAGAPHPGTEAALRHQIESMEKGQADFSVMVPSLALAALTQRERAQASISKWGALKSITFWGNDSGNDVYSVAFENQLTAWTIGPVLPDGKIGPMLFFGAAIQREGNGPSPGLEAALKRLLDGSLSGSPPLDIMAPGLQEANQRQRDVIGADAKNLGPVQAITFQAINARGWDVYQVRHANGTQTVQAAPLTDGKLTGVLESDFLMPKMPQHPGTEASLRRYIASLETGQPNYDDMEPALASTVRLQLPGILTMIKPWGALKSIVFKGGGSQNMDIYEVTFAHAKAVWDVGPLDADGKVVRRGFRQI